jgi:hypothetical protein
MKILKSFMDTSPLECPACEGDYLHQGEVDVFFRDEDAEKGNHVRVKPNSVTVDDELAGNPSPRWHGLTIDFECENCAATLCLAIVQHKGQTFCYWL